MGEHNDRELATLEELSLHQERLTAIANVGRCSPKLQILYLQGNRIAKIENLSRLKSLKYLNLALNLIELIENVEHLESLEKLDLTGNFISNLSQSVKNLHQNTNLRHLYLTGNPCTNITNYRLFIISKLPFLTSLDGQDIKTSERVQAK